MGRPQTLIGKCHLSKKDCGGSRHFVVGPAHRRAAEGGRNVKNICPH